MIESFFSTSMHLPGLFQISVGDLMAGLVFWPVLIVGVRFYRRLTLGLAGWLDRWIPKQYTDCICGHSVKDHPTLHHCLHISRSGLYDCFCSKFEAEGR